MGTQLRVVPSTYSGMGLGRGRWCVRVLGTSLARFGVGTANRFPGPGNTWYLVAGPIRTRHWVWDPAYNNHSGTSIRGNAGGARLRLACPPAVPGSDRA